MQAMARVQGEIKCIPTNTEKYISFSLGNLRFINSVNFLLSSLDKLVKGIPYHKEGSSRYNTSAASLKERHLPV